MPPIKPASQPGRSARQDDEDDEPYAQPASPPARAAASDPARAGAGTTENRVLFALVGGVVLGGLMVFFLGRYRIVTAEEFMTMGAGPARGATVVHGPAVAVPPGQEQQGGPSNAQGAPPPGNDGAQQTPPNSGGAQIKDGETHFPSGDLKPGKHKLDFSGSYFIGPAEAANVMAIFSDFECPACAQWAEGLKPTIETYKDRVKFFFKHLPLPMHPKAKGAAIAAEAAGRQGKFWEFHDLLFENNTTLGTELYPQLAGQLSLDVARFKKDLQDKELSDRVMRDFKEAERARVRGTPSIFLNGQLADIGHPGQVETLLTNALAGGAK